MTSDILSRICADKRQEVEKRKAAVSLEGLKTRAREADPPRGFRDALLQKKNESQPGLIGEIKKASPSGGLIRPDFDPAMLAQTYEEAGAACLSVLTDAPYFQGTEEDLQAARVSCSLPVLRKDFMLEPYQIYESRVLGADCVLLIMAALADDTAHALYDTAKTLGMDILVEVHDEEELNRALALEADIIGVNSRNLKTMVTDLGTAHALVSRTPETIVKVAESGIRTHDDLAGLQKAGYSAFLVGESLMRQEDLAGAVRELLGEVPAGAEEKASKTQET